MMKRNLIAILMMTAALASGCGAKASDTTTTAATQAETTQAATTQAGARQTETTQAASQEAKTEVITGKIEEIKDFMFTIENDQGTYAMTFDTAPEGLADVKEGDQVTVTYTGELSEVDAFTGTIISVEKAD